MPSTTHDLSNPVEDAYRRIAPCFGRSETRARSRRYLAGLLSRTERKNGRQLAEQSAERHPRGVQRLLDEAEWDAEEVRDELRRYVVNHLGQPGGILIVDETGFLKKGTKPAGVAYQYSGTAGRRENQQIGVFLNYASEGGCAFIDRELYLPQEWLDQPARCREAGIPKTRPFATKPQLAQQMLERTFAAAVPVRWVVGDCIYGSEDLRHWLEAQGQPDMVAVPSTHADLGAGRANRRRCPRHTASGARDGCAGRPAKAVKDPGVMIGPGSACPTPLLQQLRLA